jgi:polysaccharide biosynthesis protein PslG
MPQDLKHPMRLVRAWTAALAIAVVGAAALAPAATALPSNFWGVSPQATPSADQFQRLRTGGVDSIRVPIAWSGVQPVEGGAPDWSGVDALVRGAAQAGIDVLPFVHDAPSWAVARVAVPGSHGAVKAPKTLPVKTGAQRAAWTAFLQLAVARYGPNGAFWAKNPALPQRPIRTWQIWNEQNFKYFVVRPNPAEYGKLVQLSYAAIRGVDPEAQLVLGGMFARPKEALYKGRPRQAYFATDFLDQLYRTTPGIKSKFVGIALHPYTSRFQQLTPDIEAFRAVLKRNHDAAKSLWITEIGWSSRPPAANNSFAKGPKGQVTQLKGAFNLFKRWQVKWRLKRIYWFSVDDHPGACNFCDGSGLFGPGFVPKKSWFAYVKFAGGSPN